MKNIKVYILLFSFLLPILLNGQNKAMGKLWVGDFNNYIRIDSDAVRVNYSWSYKGKKHFHAQGHKYTFNRDTFRIVEQGYNRNETYEYLIKELSDEKFILTALNHNFRLFAIEDSVGRTLQFRPLNKISTDTIRFEKLLFSTTNCYGFCPAMTFQIDNSGLLWFKGEKYAVRQGFYQAKLSGELVRELLAILSVSELDKIENHTRLNADASTHKLEVYYNNKSMFIKSAFLPYVLDDLLAYLLDLPRKVEFESMKEIAFKFSQ